MGGCGSSMGVEGDGEGLGTDISPHRTEARECNLSPPPLPIINIRTTVSSASMCYPHILLYISCRFSKTHRRE